MAGRLYCGGGPVASKERTSYRDAGVDIAAGEALVGRIRPLAASTARPGAGAELGGFGGLFDLAAAGYRDPILVAATDGVGTKLAVAQAMGRHDTVGTDLVAMCVNDLVVQGAEPLFFLDYFATGALDADHASAVVAGIAAGCRTAGCALIGGETAEMPGFYPPGRFDLAGFAVGAVERGGVLDGTAVREGDVVLGLASSGLHSNGYSLVRRLVADEGLDLGGRAPFAAAGLGEVLLVPTRIYVRGALAALRSGGLHALVHITGGGLVENPPRILPGGLAMRLDIGSWPLPPVFAWLAERMAPRELARTFNCGLGMLAVVEEGRASALRALFEAEGETVHVVGRIVPGEGVGLAGLEGWDR